MKVVWGQWLLLLLLLLVGKVGYRGAGTHSLEFSNCARTAMLLLAYRVLVYVGGEERGNEEITT